MGCIFSSIRDACPDRETIVFYYVGRARSVAAMDAIVGKYNEGVEKFERITPRTFVDEYSPMDADRMTATLDALRIPAHLLWFIRHAIRTGPVQLPTAWGIPKVADVLENIDLVDAPANVKRDFVEFMACPFNADAFRSG